jgi:hypothetical protein
VSSEWNSKIDGIDIQITRSIPIATLDIFADGEPVKGVSLQLYPEHVLTLYCRTLTPNTIDGQGYMRNTVAVPHKFSRLGSGR